MKFKNNLFKNWGGGVVVSSFPLRAILAVLVVVLAGLNACKKDTSAFSDHGNQPVTERSDDEFGATFSAFSLSDASGLMDKRRAVAYAVSKEMALNPAFMNLVYAQLQPNAYRFKEIILGQFKNQLIQNQTVEALLNQRLQELPAYANNLSPLEGIISYDKLLTIWLPHDFIYSIPDSAFSQAIPIIVDDAAGSNLFHSGEVSTYGDESSLFAFHVSEARNHKLLNITSLKYEDTNTDFFDYHKFDLSDCQGVKSHVESIQDYAYAPGLKLINPIDDIQNMMGSLCVNEPPVPPVTEAPPMPPPTVYECQRASLELKLRGNFSKHSNKFTGFRVSNLAAFDLIESHPCNDWLINGTRPFEFTWAYAVGGEAQPQPRNKRFACYKTQLLREHIVYQARWKWVKWRFVLILEVKSRTRELLFFPFPTPPNVFSESPAGNHWTPQNNGNIVRVDAKLVHLGACGTGTTTATSHTIEGSIKFGLPIVKDGVGTFEETRSESKTATFTITATAVYDLGRTEFEYCQEYEPLGPPPVFPTNWNFIGSTGLIDLTLSAPWFN